MFQDLERRAQISRIRNLLDEANARVWTQPEFPTDHRPEAAFLRDRIHITDWTKKEAIPHPMMKPELKRHFVERTEEHNAQAGLSHIAWFEDTTRDLYFSPRALLLPDSDLRTIVYHEAATDIVDRYTIIPPKKYNPRQRSLVEASLKYAFSKKRVPAFNETRIEKSGFLEFLKIGKYTVGQLPVGDLSLNELLSVDEVYPTMVEMITNQIITRKGDLKRFDEEAAKGEVKTEGPEDHIQFASFLYAAIRFVPWRRLLEAFKLGEIERCYQLLETDGVEKARLIVDGLIATMTMDQQGIGKKNKDLLPILIEGASF